MILEMLMRGNFSFEAAVIDVLVVLLIVFLVLPFHEWAHAFTASLLGDKSIKYTGRLTLNPLSHVDPFGALCLLLFGFGWAKPVPIDTRNFKYPRTYMAITALMGPVSNILAALVGGFIYYGVLAFAGTSFMANQFGHYIFEFLALYIQINITLAVFNIIPIPPLDGSKVLFSFLPEKALMWIGRYSQYMFIIIFILLFTGVLSVPMNFMSNALLKFVNTVTRLPFTALLP